MRLVYCLFPSLALLGLSTTAALAQTAAPVASSLADARYSRADTLRAVHHLFVKRTKGAIDLLGAGVGITFKSTVATAFVADSLRDKVATNQDWLVGGALLAAGAVKLSRFSPSQYYRITAAYEQGEPLPAYVRHQLKPKFFRYRPF